LVLIIAAFYHFRGIGWGIPDPERISLVLGSREKAEQLIPVLEELHQEIEESIPYYGHPYPTSYQPDKPVKVVLSSKKIITTKDTLNAIRSYLLRSYGADEHRALVALSRMNPGKWQFDPRFYEYGGAYLYPLAVFLKVCSWFRFIRLSPNMSFYLQFPEEMGKIFAAARAFGGIGALLAILFFSLLMRRLLANRLHSFLLSACFSVMPVFVLWSFHLKPFSFAIIWVALTLYFVCEYQEKQQTFSIWLASIWAGLAMGTVLSYGYIFWGVILAIVFWSSYPAKRRRLFIQGSLLFLTTFILTNPYAICHWREFVQEILFLRKYWHTGGIRENFTFFFRYTLLAGIGLPLYIIFGLSIGFNLLYRREQTDWFWLFFLLPGWLYFACVTGYWMHYSFFLYPVLVIITARSLSKLRMGTGLNLLFTLVTIWTAAYTYTLTQLYRGENVRTLAGRWINQTIPPGDRIGMSESPSPWRTPPFRFLDYHLVIAPFPSSLPNVQKPTWFITCQEVWGRGSSLAEVKKSLAQFEVVATFQKVPVFFGRRWPMTEKIPYDLCHPNPLIHIWHRKTTRMEKDGDSGLPSD
ncbi:MAG: hypothetical protein NC911_10155, partial [Candidatus Omnitrophica bacterium]|nr:hypothetical protein [Candidatus Omnitrophota bacterium]